MDSNLTTIIVAAILYQFGTGPVRGFAVTLTLGIIASMFSAIFLCRIAFDAWMKHTNGTRLSMHGPMELRALSGYLSHFPFLKRVKHVGVLTLLLVMVAVPWVRGAAAFSTASTSRAALRRRSGSSTPFRTSSSSGRLIPCISKA